ncbi:hypothetical protein V6O07_22515 [Arthrospira platensis SPKY2]
MILEIKKLKNPEDLYIVKVRTEPKDYLVPLYEIDTPKIFKDFIKEKEDDIINNKIKIGYIFEEYNYISSFLLLQTLKFNKYTFISSILCRHPYYKKRYDIKINVITSVYNFKNLYKLNDLFYINRDEFIKVDKQELKMSKNKYNERAKTCPKCNGQGFILIKDKETGEDIWKTCDRCRGKGVI